MNRLPIYYRHIPFLNLRKLLTILRKVLVKKLNAIPREEAIINNYKVEHITYPTIKLARDVYRCLDAQYAEEELEFIKGELAVNIGEALLNMDLLKFTFESDEWGVKVRAAIEVVDRKKQ